MNLNTRSVFRAALLFVFILIITLASNILRADTTQCGDGTTTLPFTDVPGSNTFFCSIAAAYFSGLTNGTSPTTYNPGDPVLREQVAAFITRTLDQSLKRGSKRAALDQFWTTQGATLGLTIVGGNPAFVKSDGADLWVSKANGTVLRVRASDGKILETWTGAIGADGVLIARGKVFITGTSGPSTGALYEIDPTQPMGAVTTLSSNLPQFPRGIAYDGGRIWTANSDGSVSIVTLDPTTVTTVTGFSGLIGILFDGTNIWVTDQGDDTLKKVDATGVVIQSILLGGDANPQFPAFDGTNIWVPNRSSNTVTVVRAAGSLAGMVLATLSGNGLNVPNQAAFDGERVLVTNCNGGSVSLWKASDLTPIGAFSTGGLNTDPFGACSDGLNFWITLTSSGKLARF